MFIRSISRAFAVVVVCSVFQVSLLHAPKANAAILSLVPDSNFANTGDSVAVDLVVSDLGSFTAPSLGAFAADIVFDLTALSFESYALGAFLGDAGSMGSVDVSTGDAGGTVGLGEVSLLTPMALDARQPASFVLATLNFAVLNLAPAQTTLLELAPNAQLSSAAGAAISISSRTSAVITGSTPVNAPATLFLLIAAALTQCRAPGRTAANKT